MRSLQVVLGLILGLVPTAAVAAQARAELTRAYVVQRALASSPAVVAAEARVRAAGARVDASGALSDPMVSARVWGIPTRFDARPSQTMLMAEQSFPLARVRRAGARVEQAGVDASDAAGDVVAHTVALEAELMLVDVCEGDATMRALAETRALFGRLRDVAAARTLVMAADAVDVALLDVELARVEAELAEATSTSGARRAELATMLDVPVESLGACGALVEHVTGDAPTLVTRALEARPELAEAVALRTRAEAMSASAAAMSAPMLTVGAGMMIMSPSVHFESDRVQWMLEVGSTIPSFRGARRGRRAEAQAMAEEAEAMRLDRARMIARDVTRLHAMREARRARATSLVGNVTTRLATALETAIGRYGIDGDVAPVLEVVRMSREIAASRIVAELDVVRADVELTHAIGRGVGEDGDEDEDAR